MRPFLIYASAFVALGALAAGWHLGSSVHTREASRQAVPHPTMEFANPKRVAAMELLLRQTKAIPASSYAELPDETTLAESMLMQVLAYLKSVRPTDGGDGTTGALYMKALIKDASQQYDAYLSRRLGMIESTRTGEPQKESPLDVLDRAPKA
ncbi:hypothetical protein [Mesorhizobium sp.]|uniref:hypothetical protein n=1 Tax=Mesorhizobium sp. TaxID=1871066 RepID=UPI000FE78B36|nr:hypothetical protein [Mesorhizobium sp.]RWM10446.1 MAG: hypothetical protein EOR71_06720 [Mesorhizobium sp.]